jgi:hypothetical protein
MASKVPPRRRIEKTPQKLRELPDTTHPGLVCVSVVNKLFDLGVEDQWLK